MLSWIDPFVIIQYISIFYFQYRYNKNFLSKELIAEYFSFLLLEIITTNP